MSFTTCKKPKVIQVYNPWQKFLTVSGFIFFLFTCTHPHDVTLDVSNPPLTINSSEFTLESIGVVVVVANDHAAFCIVVTSVVSGDTVFVVALAVVVSPF